MFSSADQPSETFESAHPYNTSSDSPDITHTIKFSGALKIRVEFDSRCSTQLDCGVLQFFHHDDVVDNGKYHGQDWPPLVVEGEQLEARFNSSCPHFPSCSKINCWGYKFTATAISAPCVVQFDAVYDNLLCILDCAILSLLESNGSFMVPPICHNLLKNDDFLPLISSTSAQSEVLASCDNFFSQCRHAFALLLHPLKPSFLIYRCHLSHSIANAAREGSIHPLLLSSTLQFLERAYDQNSFSSLPQGVSCDRLPYNAVIVPLIASSVVAINVADLPISHLSKPVSSAMFSGIRGAVDKILSVLALSDNESFLNLVPAIEMTSVIMIQSQLSPDALEELHQEVHSYAEALLTQDSEEISWAPPNAEVLFIALSANTVAPQRVVASVSKSVFSWEALQTSLLSYVADDLSSGSTATSFAPISGLPDNVSSLPSYVISNLPLDIYTLPSNNCFEINVLDGIECIGLCALSRSDLHLHPHLLEDSARSYALHLSSNSSRSCLFHDGKLVSVLPLNSSDAVLTVSILYRPSQKQATFSVSQLKWSHTFEELPDSELYLFAKLCYADGSKTVTWNLADVGLQKEPSSFKYFKFDLLFCVIL
jgi:hypothetical protein